MSAFLGVAANRFVKTLVYRTEAGEPVVALVRGDRSLSEAKLKNALGGVAVALADEATVERVTGAPIGFAGPVGLSVRMVADRGLRGIRGAVTGANEGNHHFVGFDLERDASGVEFADLVAAAAGDRCGRCNEGRFEIHRGIEVGQVFYLGRRYSEPLHATFLDPAGVERTIEMGTYGIGITRTVAAAIEQNHDAQGIIWPVPLAPFAAAVVPVNRADEAVWTASESIYRELLSRGVDTLLDDRDERPGVKFKDADLIGFPLRVTVGPKALARGNVELKARRAEKADEVPIGDVAARVADELASAS